MKQTIEQLLTTAVEQLQQKGELTLDSAPVVRVEHTRDQQHGDFACNIALTLAKAARCKPRDLAEKIVAHLPTNKIIQRVEIAGPGFINLFLVADAWLNTVKEILQQGATYGASQLGKGERLLVEFVSSNPTGPLHVGHGRSAAYGAALCNLLAAVGFNVHREYYVNDGGRQMNILATSVWLRYLNSCGEKFKFPSNGYQGDYILTIAEQLKQKYGKQFLHSTAEVFKDVPPDVEEGGDKELHIDGLIERAQILLGTNNYGIVIDTVLANILTDIKDDLAEFGVQYQEWFSERSLLKNDGVKHVIEKLTSQGHLYEQDGALWFRATTFGDDKDRVVLRENGQPTYFAVDAAYHLNKFERGFSRIIDIFGSDHHGYVPRLRAVIAAFGFDPARLITPIVQFAILYRGTERVQMSTRSGSFVTLRELRNEVGNDAARFFYVQRKCEQHLEFDLELAKSHSNENPVFYVQYAHARICSVLRQLEAKGLRWDQTVGVTALARLTEPQEQVLLGELSRYPEVIEMAAAQYEPHVLAHYLKDLAAAFHSYYNTHAFIVDDESLRNARLALVMATRQVLINGLTLLGVSAPEVM